MLTQTAGTLSTAGVALAAILALILLAGHLAKRFKLPHAATGPLALRGTLALDSRRRLHLIDAQGHTALILTGGTTDICLLLPPDRA